MSSRKPPFPYGGPVEDLLQDTSKQGPHPSHLGGVNVHLLPAQPSFVPAYIHRQPRIKALSDIDQKLHQVRSKLLDQHGLVTANAARYTGNSSHSLTFPSYSGPGHFPQSGRGGSSVPGFLQQKVAGVPAWALGLGALYFLV